MSKFTILAGDFPSGKAHFSFRSLTLPGDINHYLCETVNIGQLESLNKINKSMANMLEINEGSLQLLDNLAQDQVLFIARLKDKRRFLGLSDKKTFDKMTRLRRVESSQHQPISKSSLA